MRIMTRKTPRSRATVTVVIPCYNYGHYLPGIVDSVLSQEGVEARVIIVDDASSDGSGAVAQRLADEDPRVSVLVHEHNKGHIATYNDGLALVETEYVALVSADDLVAPGALARATGLMATHPKVGMVYGLAISFSNETELFSPRRTMPETWTVWHGHEWIRLAVLRGRNFILSPEVVMRTSAVHQVGGYNADLPHSGDLEYWLRTASRWDVGRINGLPQAYYRVHGGNMHLTRFATMAVDLRHRLSAFDVLASNSLSSHVPNGRKHLQRARKAVAREALLIATRELDSGVSAVAVQPLMAFAEEVNPRRNRSLSSRLLNWRIGRANKGKAPTSIQRFIEFWRRQLDRLRWRAWKAVGIS